MTDAWPVALAQGWHPVAYAHEVGKKPFAVSLMGHPLVLFRHENGVTALTNRCPHRNVPLSGGIVSQGALQCPYHGWRFDQNGECVEVPGSLSCPKIMTKSFAVTETSGLIWVSLSETPPPFPALLPEMGDDSFDHFWWPLPAAKARILDALENHLDPAHPHYLHPWLVRKPDQRKSVKAVLTTYANGAIAHYTEEMTMGWLPRLFEGERKSSHGRLLAPCTGQVAFTDSKGMTIAITVIFSPEDHNRTRPFAHFASRKGRLPAWIKKHLIIAFHRNVLRQDKAMLATQVETITRFGKIDYTVGPLDLMGPVLWRLANGQPQKDEVREFNFML